MRRASARGAARTAFMTCLQSEVGCDVGTLHRSCPWVKSPRAAAQPAQPRSRESLRFMPGGVAMSVSGVSLRTRRADAHKPHGAGFSAASPGLPAPEAERRQGRDVRPPRIVVTVHSPLRASTPCQPSRCPRRSCRSRQPVERLADDALDVYSIGACRSIEERRGSTAVLRALGGWGAPTWPPMSLGGLKYCGSDSGFQTALSRSERFRTVAHFNCLVPRGGATST